MSPAIGASGEHAIFVDSQDEFIRKVRYYAHPAHESERKRIVQAAARLIEAAPLSRLAKTAVGGMRDALQAWRRRRDDNGRPVD